MINAPISLSHHLQVVQPKLPDVLQVAATRENECGSAFQFNFSGPSSSRIGSVLETKLNVEPSHSQLALRVENIIKSYDGHGTAKVLDNFSMNVPTGAIYSLLGSSGCGKTTILSCIVGLRPYESGTITVLGQRIGSCQGISDGENISKKIGYMPQELALYEHLTVNEIIKYFGKLHGMSSVDIATRLNALIKLLDLGPKRFAKIEDLSGGQKRRVSLALALVSNSNELLILDEPTVGLDPVLRRRIWEHLSELVGTKRTAVLITTHYIEETRHSDRVGVMRNGKMLVEESPQVLLSNYRTHYIQDAILKICRSDQKESRDGLNGASIEETARTRSNSCSLFRKINSTRSQESPEFTRSNVAFTMYNKIDPDEFLSQHCPDKSGKSHLIHHLSTDSNCENSNFQNVKNTIHQSVVRTLSYSIIMWIFLLRQPIFAFILVFLPAIQLVMTFFIVGKEPVGLSVGVINREVEGLTSDDSLFEFCRNRTLAESSCDSTFLSCLAINYITQHGKLNMVSAENPLEMEEQTREGSLFGYLLFPQNYSENLVNRYVFGKFASDNDTLEGSKLMVIVDKSHYLAYHLIIKEILGSLETLANDLGASCGFMQPSNQIPLHFREPVFGKLNGTHQDTIIPAIVAQILFEILYGIAPMILIKDLKQGTFERSSLAGLKFSEFMLGVFVTMCPILVVQSVSCYLVLQHGFNFSVEGSLFLFLLLCVLAGLCGQGFGIFMGILVRSEFAVIVSAIMIIPIIMTCSGTLWPLEAHPPYLKVIYYIFPSAPIVSSLRSVISRGVGITHFTVWPGFLNTLLWSVAFWILSVYGYKRMSQK